MKIDAAKSWGAVTSDGKLCCWSVPNEGDVYARAEDRRAVRIVRESDWRRIMAVVKAADSNLDEDGNCRPDIYTLYSHTRFAVIQLREHLAKRKSK